MPLSAEVAGVELVDSTDLENGRVGRRESRHAVRSTGAGRVVQSGRATRARSADEWMRMSRVRTGVIVLLLTLVEQKNKR
jgi:hypothetical protein